MTNKARLNSGFPVRPSKIDVGNLLRPSALPAGFSLHGLRCGISAKPGKKDLALFLSERPARAAGVFTANLVQAAPVRLSRRHLRVQPYCKAVIINSGCANACTGPRGDADARWTARALAGGLGVPASSILVGSTGVIGRYLPRPALARGLEDILRLSRARSSAPAEAVAAIMTTDTRPKAARAVFSWKGKRFTVWGCAKGAGMIHPDMATMLSVLLTDLGMPAPELRAGLRGAAANTFNRLTVDGDTSTNDSVFLLANGAIADVRRPPAALRERFRSALTEVCLSLAVQIASDGEGATRTAWILVEGARTASAAARLAAAVATSPLVKTALHGADPNWGRVLAALGRAGVRFDPDKVDVRFGGITVCRRGRRAPHSEAAVHRLMKRDPVVIRIGLHEGKAGSHYVTCDYSRDYIAINADYTT